MVTLLKQPLNMVEQPVAPFIKKNPPRFVWSKRKNNVDVGLILRDTETDTQRYDNAVLSVPYDHSSNKYGVRSWRGPYVDEGFRPPLTDPEFDGVALSRLNRPRTQARTNPTAPYKTQNDHDPDVGSYIQSTVINSGVKANIQLRRESPEDLYQNPQLEFNRPQTSSTANQSYNYRNAPRRDIKAIEGTLRYSTPVTSAQTQQSYDYNPQEQYQHHSLSYTSPQTNATTIESFDYKTDNITGATVKIVNNAKASGYSNASKQRREISVPSEKSAQLRTGEARPTTSGYTQKKMIQDNPSRYTPSHIKVKTTIQPSSTTFKEFKFHRQDNLNRSVILNSTKPSVGNYSVPASLPSTLQNRTIQLKSTRR